MYLKNVAIPKFLEWWNATIFKVDKNNSCLLDRVANICAKFDSLDGFLICGANSVVEHHRKRTKIMQGCPFDD